MMRRGFIVGGMGLLFLWALTAQANLLTNPGFEDGPTGPINSPIPGWSTWGSDGWHHDLSLIHISEPTRPY